MNYQDKVVLLAKRLAEIKIIPVLAVENAASAAPLGRTLSENGLPCAEVTFRTEAAADAMKVIKQECPDVVVGAGTVLTKAQVDLAIEAGADFAVSPGFNPETVRYAMSRGLPFIPGVNNPSLVEQAMEMGFNVLKFFPAEPSGGINMLKAMQSVYPVRFMPTGGIKAQNAKDYLALNTVFCCGGTWMVPQSLIDNEDWEQIASLTKEAAALVR